MIKRLTMFLAIGAVAGCASIAIPADSLEHNQAGIRAAQEVGAASVPAARLHLQMAIDETVSAKRLAERGDNRALVMLACASADAELAVGMAREATVHSDALKAAEDLKALRARGEK
jgi:hypothetical protein